MRSRGHLLHRASLGAAVLAVVAILLAGCSTSNPTGSSTEDWGSLEGSVSSDRGAWLPNIEVHLWTEIGEERTVVQYDAVTNANGVYEIEEIDLSHVTGNSEDYEIYVNRTKGSALPINEGYGAYASTVTIEKGAVATADIEIVEEGPIDPEQYFD
jgi:hypothetical protein